VSRPVATGEGGIAGGDHDGQDRGIRCVVHLKSTHSTERGGDDVHEGQIPGKRIEPKRLFLDTLDLGNKQLFATKIKSGIYKGGYPPQDIGTLGVHTFLIISSQFGRTPGSKEIVAEMIRLLYEKRSDWEKNFALSDTTFTNEDYAIGKPLVEDRKNIKLPYPMHAGTECYFVTKACRDEKMFNVEKSSMEVYWYITVFIVQISAFMWCTGLILIVVVMMKKAKETRVPQQPLPSPSLPTDEE
jgi:hypothetical protein